MLMAALWNDSEGTASGRRADRGPAPEDLCKGRMRRIPDGRERQAV